MSFTEDNYEKAVTALFEQMGYTNSVQNNF